MRLADALGPQVDPVQGRPQAQLDLKKREYGDR